MERIRVSIEKIKELLANGYAKYEDSANREGAEGSVQAYYGLNKKQALAMFKDERIKHLKTTTVGIIEFEEDLIPVPVAPAPEMEAAVEETSTEEVSDSTSVESASEVRNVPRAVVSNEAIAEGVAMPVGESPSMNAEGPF